MSHKMSAKKSLVCGILSLMFALTIICATAQQITILHGFDDQDGAFANSIVQGLDGDLYGTTEVGTNQLGQGGDGIIFKTTPEGAFTTLHKFCNPVPACPDGIFPSGIILGTDGNFYGTTRLGGVPESNSGGTVFKITLSELSQRSINSVP